MSASPKGPRALLARLRALRARMRSALGAFGARVRGSTKTAREEFMGSARPSLRKDAAFLREFKPDATAIEERPVPVSIYAVMYTVCALLVCAVAWAFIGTMDRIVVAQGKVTTTARQMVLQPFGVSKILAVHVKTGDRVRKGDVLISFDPAFAKADESSFISKVNALDATRARMEAEVDGTEFEVSENALPERLTQAEILRARKAQLASELARRDSNLRKISAQIVANVATVKGLKQQLKLAHEVTEMRQKLRDKQVGSELQLVVAQKDELDTEQRLRDASSEGASLAQERTQAAAERSVFLENWSSQLNQDLATVRQQAKEALDSLTKARRMSDFTSLVAPVDAVVLEIADRSTGSVLHEAETAVTLVPADAPLEVEADVLSKDVGYVSVGDPVRVKLEAYPFQKFGTLTGALSVVSPDSIVRQTGQTSITVFHATVHLNDNVDKLTARGVRLRPGLIATAEITTGRRSIASYILYPVLRMFDEGMKEP